MATASKLGKGLSALMADDYSEHTLGDAAAAKGLKEIPLDLLVSGQYQPRRHFDERYLQELAESIGKNGIMQPLVVRAVEGQEPARYEIIAGERRWRAAKIAGLYSVPAIIREIDNKQALELALIENVQRQDLTPLEEGEGYQRLMDEFGYTQEELSTTVGKSRSHIANLLRLLHLPVEVKEMISRGELSMGHARALVGSSAALEVAREVVRRGLNVRQTENLTRAGVPKADRPRGNSRQPAPQAWGASKDPDLLSLEATLSETLGMRVSIQDKGQHGDIVVSYDSLEQLDEILRRLGGSV